MDEFLISAKHDDVWMPERTSGGIVDLPHAGGEPLKPFEDRLAGYRIGDWQGKFFTHDFPHRYGKSIATILVIRFCQCSNVASLTVIQSHRMPRQLKKPRRRLARSAPTAACRTGPNRQIFPLGVGRWWRFGMGSRQWLQFQPVRICPCQPRVELRRPLIKC